MMNPDMDSDSDAFTPPTPAQISSYHTHGFLILPATTSALVPPALFPALLSACEAVTARTRAGAWPHRRVVGKQFPPYGSAHSDSWGVQHVMHPDLGERAFAEYYAGYRVRRVACALLGCEEACLQMELFNLLINPTENEFSLRWHRDDVKGEATEDEERKALAIPHHGLQWNTALHEDASLYVVPGSHKVPRTPTQRVLSTGADAPANPFDMPGAICVVLHPGDTVFYNNNIVHCATYSPAAQRATLHASIGDTRGGTARARNILQHGLTWMREDRFKETLSADGQAMLARLEDMQRAVGEQGSLGYSLDG
ncbi:hypothetical protein FA95DRAFT_1558315 [Auriscalpium vulgare]|uniref:Uncharacterized protein n=1 Tax=Auriscalpium vulgare TaxID=40419 RepID=A0ACB8RX28_9AGAM|nr:hypothetical protein FA95DRAFT_1558315 [Auriscalpium vulgare]